MKVTKSKSGYKLLIFAAPILFLFSLCLTPTEEVIEEKELRIYVGACMKGAVSEIADKFESENPGVRIKVVAKGSGGLLDNIGEWRAGDVFMPGEESFATEAIEKDYMDAYTPAAYHRLTIIVPESSQIKGLEDMTNDSIRVVVGGYDTAMGRMLVETIGETHIYEEIRDNYVYLEESKCSRIPKAVAEKHADVGISCSPSALRVEGVYAMDIPEFTNRSFIIPIGVLKFSKNTETAQDFVEFVKSEDGRNIMAKYGFEPVQGE